MISDNNKRAWLYGIVFLFLITVVLWLAVLARPSLNLRLIACDVGQGDALLITRGSMQILIDGGPNNSVISCLSRHMPFWDRQLEAVVLTHADADHYTGLVEVVKRYSIKNFIRTEVDKESTGYNTLKDLIAATDIPVTLAQEDVTLRNGLLSIDVLTPTAEMLAENPHPAKVNDYSIVVHLVYGQFDAILTGDIETKMSDVVAEKVARIGTEIEYLKVPHHGSINGLSQLLLNTVNPEVAVISVGAKNRYGHPRAEILQMLEAKNLKILRTDEMGDVVVETDGKSWRVR